MRKHSDSKIIPFAENRRKLYVECRFDENDNSGFPKITSFFKTKNTNKNTFRVCVTKQI